MKSLFGRGLAASCWIVFAAGPAVGQGAGSLPASPPLPPIQGQGGTPGSSDPGSGPLPPYQPQLEQLADLLGTLTYLRDLCGKGDGAQWRARMTALIDAEGGTDLQRERLAGAFNHGFRGYEATYRTCTPAAELVIRRAIDEGDRLTRELAGRFGDD